MKIISSPTKYFQYAFDFDFSLSLLEFCRHIKSKVGYQNFNFCSENKKWAFNDLTIVDIINNKYSELEIDESVQDDWRGYLIKKAEKELVAERAEKLKVKTTSDLVIKGLKGKPYDFQLVGTEFLINNKGRAIINSDPGTGKSLQALSYVVYEKINKTLIITPASVKWAFHSEVLKWTNLKPFVIDSQTKFTIDVFNNNDVFIINYDILRKFFTQLTNFRFDCLIIDEVQKIKSLVAIRTKATKQIAKRIPKVIMLTGTLMLSRPSELFNPLNILDPFVWNNWRYFTKKFCDGHDTHWGYDFSGASNIDELKQLISKYYIRHLKEDVLKDLPEKVFIDLPMELDGESRFKYNLALNSFIEYLKDIKNRSRNEIEKSLQAEKLVKLNELRQIATNGKIDTVKELIEDIIESDQKVIVFSNYNEPLKKLQEKFGEVAVLLTGETPELVRKQIINDFQNNQKVKVFLCGFSSGGVGITLTAAENIIFTDFPWNPADLEQAYGRAHRIGNKADHVNIYQVIAKDTIDTKIKSILDGKQYLIDKIFNKDVSKKIKQTSMVGDLIKEIGKEI
jgi:SWI/SNF-related matrix-associated actin-dependent regulator 1 of chromatin subfamily A